VPFGQQAAPMKQMIGFAPPVSASFAKIKETSSQ
jgi:hypothetical protein